MKISDRIKKKNILVIGDIMLDTYFEGDVTRISPEAPVPIFRKRIEHCALGGAGNVATNLIAAGQNVLMMSIVGKDKVGEKIVDILEKHGIDISLLFFLNRCSTEKTRFLSSNNQQVMRLDVEDTSLLGHDDCEKMLRTLNGRIDEIDLIVISDYLKGLLSFEFTSKVIKMAKEKDILVIIDVKDSNVEKYKNSYLVKPNLKELQEITGITVNNDDEIVYASNILREMCNSKYVLTTCGARGMVLIGGDEPYFVDSVGKKVFDVTGAGDTTIAYLASCLANEFDINDAIDIANCSAGIQVSKVGTSAVYWREVLEQLEGKNRLFNGKILSKDELRTFRLDNEGKKIVFTNGCFDILHVGHIRYMQEASKLGDILVVGLNSDNSVRRLKGPDRPINSQDERAEMLASLEFVDYVVIFDEDTPYDLIMKIQPDVLVKGGDYNPNNVVGKDIVEARGGELRLINFVEGKSTTNIINKIKK